MLVFSLAAAIDLASDTTEAVSGGMMDFDRNATRAGMVSYQGRHNDGVRTGAFGKTRDTINTGREKAVKAGAAKVGHTLIGKAGGVVGGATILLCCCSP